MRSMLLIGILGAILCGCQTVCRSTGGMAVSLQEGGMTAISVDDSCFSDWLDIVNSSLRRVDSGCLKAQVSIRNKKKDYMDGDRMDDFTAQYKFTWFDADGAISGTGESNWSSVTWHGGEVKPLDSVSPNPSSVRFVLTVRHVR